MQSSRLEDQRCALPINFPVSIHHWRVVESGFVYVSAIVFFQSSSSCHSSRRENSKEHVDKVPVILCVLWLGVTVILKVFMFQVLARGPPYPSILMPPQGGYWMDGVSSSHITLEDDMIPSTNVNSCQRFKLEHDETSKCYRRHFYGKVYYKMCFLH